MKERRSRCWGSLNRGRSRCLLVSVERCGAIEWFLSGCIDHGCLSRRTKTAKRRGCLCCRGRKIHGRIGSERRGCCRVFLVRGRRRCCRVRAGGVLTANRLYERSRSSMRSRGKGARCKRLLRSIVISLMFGVRRAWGRLLVGTVTDTKSRSRTRFCLFILFL